MATLNGEKSNQVSGESGIPEKSPDGEGGEVVQILSYKDRVLGKTVNARDDDRAFPGLASIPANFIANNGIPTHSNLVQGLTMVQILSSKYLQNDAILTAKLKPRDSYVWWSVIKAKDVLLDGFSSQLGDGQSFWYSNQLADGKLCMKVSYVHESSVCCIE
ncbi:hypothetical protein JHK82_053171 [Glycine max]|nr:hypothetical protein JHK82_053171 [Glycine max]